MLLQRTRACPPPELVAWAVLPDPELDAVELADTEEPMLPLALALPLPPETDEYVYT
ncbi:MAG: hypothetical protein ACREB8_17020 [Pseudolabrys sp.]